MYNYVVFVTSELAPISTNFIDHSLTKFFTDFKSAVQYGISCVSEISKYPALSDFYIYSLVHSDEGTDPFVP